MNKLKVTVVSALLVLALTAIASATPSTVYWTPATTYFQPFGKGHIGYDSYVRSFNAAANDYGFTVGILPFKEVQAEIGYDALLPAAQDNQASYVNAKIGIPENTLLPFGIAAGIFNAGFVQDTTDYDVFYGVIQKTIDNIGTFAAGGYSGNKKLLVNDNGGADNTGYMLGYTSPQFSKFIIAADYMSGNNTLSAWGAGLYTYFADNVTLLVGPVFPLSKQFAGSDKPTFTMQLDIDFDIIPPAPAAK